MLKKYLTLFYHLVTASILFYLYLLRGMVVYGFVPSLCTLLATVRYIVTEQGEMKVKEFFENKFNMIRGHKLLSFVLVFSFSLIAAALFFTLQRDGPWSAIWLVVWSYSLILLTMLTAYSTYLLSHHHMDARRALIYAFIFSIKKWGISLAVLVMMGFLAGLAFLNLFLLFVLGPFLYGLGIHLLLGNIQFSGQHMSEKIKH